MGFDGKTYWMAQHMTGAIGQSHLYLGGHIMPPPPLLLDNRYETGRAFSALVRKNWEENSLSDYLEFLRDLRSPAGWVMTIDTEVFQETKATRITIENEKKTFEWRFLLDQTRGWALLRYCAETHRTGQAVLINPDDRVTKFVEAAPGIWYPKEAVHEWIDRGKRVRLHYTASEVVINDAHFDEAIFGPAFSQRYVIDDKVKKSVYRAGPEMLGVQTELDREIEEMAAGQKKTGQ